VFAEFFTQLIRSGQLFNMIGNALGNLFESMVTGTKSAKAIFYQFLAEILSGLGSMAIAVGGVLLVLPPWLGGNPAMGWALIAAGVAALALAGVFRGLASNAQKQAEPGAGAGAGAGGTSGTAGTAARTGTVIPFPTSGPIPDQIVIINKFDQGGLRAAMKGEDFVTMSDLKGPKNRTLKKAVKKTAT
jgi:hypothetical protein